MAQKVILSCIIYGIGKLTQLPLSKNLCQLTKESVVLTSCPSKVYVAADNAVAIVTTGLNLGAVSCISVAGGHEQV